MEKTTRATTAGEYPDSGVILNKMKVEICGLTIELRKERLCDRHSVYRQTISIRGRLAENACWDPNDVERLGVALLCAARLAKGNP